MNEPTEKEREICKRKKPKKTKTDNLQRRIASYLRYLRTQMQQDRHVPIFSVGGGC